MATGTGRLGGTVTDGSGRPLRRVVIKLAGRGPTAGRSFTTTTDARGRYSFRNLPAGTYVAEASKPGYVTLTYGQTRAFEPSTPLAIGADALENVNLTLIRGAVVIGQVVDDRGETVADAVITALRSEYSRGRRQMTIVSTGRDLVRTNDLGEFRMAGLAPGKYVISAMLGGAFTDNEGDEALFAYARTYYPSALTLDEAEVVTVGAGEVNASITLRPAALVKVGGVVVDSAGTAPSRAMVRIASLAETGASARAIPVRPDGSFQADIVAIPGPYAVTVTTATGTRPGDPQNVEMGRTLLNIDGTDVTDLRIVTAGGAIVAGTIVVEGGRPAAFAPRRLVTQAADRGDVWISANAPIRPDGTFELRNVFGRSLITIDTPIEAGWMVKSVSAGGNDVTETGIDAASGARVDDVRVVIARANTGIAGTVVSEDGKPAGNAIALVFAETESRWKDPLGRYVRYARTDASGRFTMVGIPPGRYKTAALTSLDVGSATDPDLLKSLKASAHSLALADGETATITARVRKE